METKWLEDFVSLAETNSFSRSAELRHVTQPAFSRRIQSLEAWLGTDLIDRTSYPTRLTHAGEVFFERLERLGAHRDSPQLANVLEVYYLCLLLGYEGRYAVGNKADLRILMDNLRERIERIIPSTVPFSPEGALPPRASAPVVVEDSLPARLRVLAMAVAGSAILLFLLFQIHLHWLTGNLDDLARQAAPR